MVMKVNSVNSIYFKAGSDKKVEANESPVTKPQINELQSVMPDYNIRVPLKYTKTGVYELSNGLNVHSYKLANGYRVNIVPMEGSPAVVKNYVNVGSMNETANIKGISHFLEHMAFNGTNGEDGHIKLNAGDSFKKIDELGGWTNASTNYAVTDYVNSTPLLNKSDLEKQIQVIAAMTEDLKLSDDMIAKEKGPVCSEINMILDNPQTIALDQTVRALYNIKNPTDEMVGGSVKTIQSLTSRDVREYYEKYYTPDNMNLVITGDVNPDEAMKIVSKSFNSNKVSKGKKFEERLIPIQKTIRKDFISDKAVSVDTIIGFAGPKNSDLKERVAFDVAKAYLESSGCLLNKNLRKYNAYPYIESEKIGTNPNTPRMVYVAYNTSEKHSEDALKSVYDAFSDVWPVTEKELASLKQNIKKDREDSLEYSSIVNDKLGYAVLDGNIEYFTDYEKILDSLTPQDVDKAVKNYFDLNKAAIILVHPPKENVSFKGNIQRQPINMQKVQACTLKNNYEVGTYKTKNNNINYNISLCLNEPYNKKPGVIELLNEVYDMGVKGISEEEWDSFQDENGLNFFASLTNSKLKIFSSGIYDNRAKVFENAKEFLYNPNLTQENLDRAKQNIRDNISKRQSSAQRLYFNWEAGNNSYEFSEQEILDNLDNITLDDLKECHNYILQNSRGIVTANIPEQGSDNVRQEILDSVSELNQVKPNIVKTVPLYNPNKNGVVLSKATKNSQADIMQVYKFKSDDTVKEAAAAAVLNSILSSSSIGLFDNLREKEHLAYSVYSSIEKHNDRGELSCHILTTTDNKEIGEISYDNVQKSIEGFKRQINALRNGEFTDKDFENAKLVIKAELITNEGVSTKLGNLGVGMNSKHGIDYINKIYAEIDNITRDDILQLAEKIFSSKPVYSIAASKDTLAANKAYLESLSE